MDSTSRSTDGFCFYIQLKDLIPDKNRDINILMAKIIKICNTHPKRQALFDESPLIFTGRNTGEHAVFL